MKQGIYHKFEMSFLARQAAEFAGMLRVRNELWQQGGGQVTEPCQTGRLGMRLADVRGSC
jgi:hypothetical protein